MDWYDTMVGIGNNIKYMTKSSVVYNERKSRSYEPKRGLLQEVLLVIGSGYFTLLSFCSF